MNINGPCCLVQQGDRLETGDQISGLMVPKSETLNHQNCQLMAAAAPWQQRQASVKNDHLTRECQMRRFEGMSQSGIRVLIHSAHCNNLRRPRAANNAADSESAWFHRRWTVWPVSQRHRILGVRSSMASVLATASDLSLEQTVEGLDNSHARQRLPRTISARGMPENFKIISELFSAT